MNDLQTGPAAATDDARPKLPRLPRAVILLGWVSFFADVSSEMIYPLMPLFIIGVLGSSKTTLGGIEGGAQCLAALMTAWAGWHSDRRRARIAYVRVGYGLPVVGKALLTLAWAWPVVLIGRLIDRFGKGVRTSPRDALLVDVTPPEIMGHAFGLHRAMDTAGALVGVLLAALLLAWLDGTSATGTPFALKHADHAFRIIFGISAVMGLTALGITFMLRDPKPPPLETARPPSRASQPAQRLGLPRAYWFTLLIMLTFAFANSSDHFLLWRGANVGLSPVQVVLAYALFNLTYTLVSYPAGMLSDRLGRWPVIAAGWLIYAAVYAGFAMTDSWGIWPLMAIYGVYMALTEGVGKALIADHAPADRRGTAMGIFYTATGLMTLAASLIAGQLWDHFGPATMFWLGSAAATLAVLLIPIFRMRAAQKT